MNKQTKIRRDITGQIFNGIEAIKFVGRDKNEKARWLFECHCGKQFESDGYSITSGHCVSCGCKQYDRGHGLSRTRLYNIWVGMKQRCENPNCVSYRKYGALGITYEKRWKVFQNFLADMGKEYRPGLTLDRIDNTKGYYRSNCKWSTAKEQARNTRRNHTIEWRGESKCVSEWAEITGIKRETIYARVRYGWDTERVLGEDVHHSR